MVFNGLSYGLLRVGESRPSWRFLTGKQTGLGDQLSILVCFGKNCHFNQFFRVFQLGNITVSLWHHHVEWAIAHAGEKRLKLVQQIQVFSDAVDDVPDLVGVVSEDCGQL